MSNPFADTFCGALQHVAHMFERTSAEASTGRPIDEDDLVAQIMDHQNTGLPDDERESLLRQRLAPASVRNARRQSRNQRTGTPANARPIATGGTVSAVVVSQAYAMLDTKNKKVGQKYSSTETKIAPIQKNWNAFCIQEGINPTSCPRFLKEDDLEYDLHKMRSFVQYLDIPNVKITQIENGLLFIQHYLNRDCDAFDKPKVIGAVKGDFAIKSIMEKHKRTRASRAMENGEDIQADLDVRVSEEQMDGMMRECFNPRDKGVAAMSELARLQTAAEMRHSHSTGERGGNIRAYLACMSFTREARGIGPTRNGMEIDYLITNKGKMNQQGKFTYTSIAPHMNPLWDTIGLQGKKRKLKSNDLLLHNRLMCASV